MHESIWIIPLAPLVGAIINGKLAVLYARRERGPSEKLISFIGVAAPLVSFVVACSVFLHFRGLEGTERMVTVDLFPWIVSGNLNIGFSLMIDSLSMLMVLVVTGIGAVIHIYSVGYMHGDRGYARYFAYLNLFMFSMLMLVMGKNLLILFVGWEGVGLCSYLLIGFWYKDLANAAAGKKAFIVNRIGDFAFLIGMFVLFVATSRMGEGTLDFVTLRAMVSEHPQAFAATATAAGILLFIGACGKSAQIPLFVWLPDAMAGPTPVSALIHAATMVTAGVYMVTRLSFLYLQSDVAMAVVATVGAFTALFAATIGIAQRDIKKVLAYSTISQLGYMFVALGMGAFSAGIFHLMTHAFFKACLFLGSGSVIHAMGGEQDMFKMGALGKKMKITALTFIIASIAIAGVPPLAGFFSKDEILFYTFTSHVQPLGMVLWGLLFIGAGITAFYVFRAVFLTFFGKRRHTDEVAEHVHEAPLSMTIPLVLLAVGAIFAGLLGVPGVLGGSNQLHHYLEPSLGLLSVHGDDVSHAVAAAGHARAEVTLMVLSVLAGLLGIFVAYVLYIRRPDKPAQITAKLGRFYHLVYNKYFVDEAYDAMIVKPGYVISNRFLFGFIDVKFIDTIVNTIGVSTRLIGSLFRLLQTGVVRTYALFFLIGILFVIYKMVG